MAQAKTLTPAELDQVLDFISHRSFALRNRVMLLTGMWSGMRVSEIASLSVSDVMNANGTIKAEIRLTAEQTKGRQPRTVFLPQKLRDELHPYMELRKPQNLAHPLFITAGRRGFTANVMTQHFFGCLRRQVFQAPAVTPCVAASSPRWPAKALAYVCLLVLQDTAQLLLHNDTLTYTTI